MRWTIVAIYFAQKQASMAEIFRVDIQFHPQQESLLIIPEEIKVPQFSVVQWNIIGPDKYFFEHNFWRRGLIFTLYFDKESPFRWKRQFVQVHEDPRFYPNYPTRLLRLAEDVTDEKGNYRYAVTVSNAEDNEALYEAGKMLVVT